MTLSMAEEPPSSPPSSHRRRYRIGYALAPKKQQSFIRDSLVSLARDRSIYLIKIDTVKPLIEQGPFDCVLHKLYGDDWRRQLADYKAKNPNVVIVDAPEAIERLHNRVSMLQVVSELKIVRNGGETFGIPKQIVIYDAETLRDTRSWERLKFPVIAKPLVADGSAKSHKMSLVYNHGGLSSLKPPIVLQEFVNHGGVIFKVYVVGEYVKCVKRKSLPDVSEEKLESLGGVLTFSQVSNLGSNEKADEKYYKMMQLDDCEMPPLQFITDIARGLRQALKLNLFNFDVIRDTSLGNRKSMPFVASRGGKYFIFWLSEEQGLPKADAKHLEHAFCEKASAHKSKFKVEPNYSSDLGSSTSSVEQCVGV